MKDIDRRWRMLARLETQERRSLERTLLRAERMQKAAQLESPTKAQDRTIDHKARQDFHDAARDQGLWQKREFASGELTQNFNDEAGFIEGAQ